MTQAQLQALGVTSANVSRWTHAGYLYRELPTVYAVGHPGASDESALFAAILYAGPGAGLCGLSAAVWRGLVKWRTPPAIELATPRRCRSLATDDRGNGLGQAIVVHDRRRFRRSTHHGIPTVPISQIVLDLAASGDLQLVRFALAQLDFMRILNVPELARACGQGRPGTSVLREALSNQQPLLARTRSPFEVRLIRVCELTGIPLPEINAKIGTMTVDALWRDEMLVVECDGKDNHETWAQRRRDSAQDVALRRLGFLPIRYTSDALDDAWAVHADLTAQLEERRGRRALHPG